MRRWMPLLYLFTLALTSACFPHQPGPTLAHFDSQAPRLGQPAPLFALQDLKGNTVELADLIGEKPIVLQFGSHSCPVYRYRRHWMNGLFEDFHDQAHFLVVYTIEAHPVGSVSPYRDTEWDTWWNRYTGVRVCQAEDLAARNQQANTSLTQLELPQMMLVDEMNNAVWQAYGSASSPAFVIDQQGRIAARQVWINPKEIRRVLNHLLTSF